MQISVERFKNIRSVDCPTTGIVLLVGGNNAGKSSVLQAMQFGVSVAQTSKMQSGVWVSDRLSTSIGQSDLVYSPIRDVSSLASNGRLREDANEAISINYKDDGGECRVTVRKGRNKNILLGLAGKNVGERLQSIDKPYCALVTGLAGIPSEEGYETNIVVRKAAARGDSNSVFRNILLQLRKVPEKWQKFQEQITRIFPDYLIDVSFDPDTDEHIECTVTRSGLTFPIDTCGTGVLQAIQIFSYINLFEPKILLLDEPDSHLHPNNQKLLAKELISASDAGLNIVISSHSRHLVESLLDHATLVWLRNGVVEPNVEDYELRALMEIGALSVGDRIGNPEYVFLTEDENRALLEILLEANGYDLGECEIVSYSGATNINTALVLLNQLRKSVPNAKFSIHRDRDFKSDSEIESYSAKFLAQNVRVFVPDGNDLESYFTSKDHLTKSCDVEDDKAEAILCAAFEARKTDLQKKYVNTRIENLKKLGEGINAGEISVECSLLLTSYTSKAVHGKIFLKGIRDELKRQGISDHVISNSAALQIASLKNLWQTEPQRDLEV